MAASFLATVAALTAGTVAARLPPEQVHLGNRQVWLASATTGHVVLVDGATAEVVRSVPFPFGTRLSELHQWGQDAIGLDHLGWLLHADYTTQDLLGPRRILGADRPASLAIGGGRVFAIPRAGRVSAIDPRTFTAVGTAPLPAGGSVHAADAQGRLWLLDRKSGRLSWFDGRTIGQSSLGPAAPGAILVPGAAVVLVDPRLHRLTIPAEEVTCTVTGGLDGAVFAPGDRAGRVLATSAAAGAIRLLDLGASDPEGHCATTVIPIVPGQDWGEPVLGSGRIYLPNRDRGTIQVLDVARAGQVAAPRVAPPGSALSLVQRAGLVYYNDPGGASAGVIYPDGRVVPIDKEGTPEPGAVSATHRPPTPPASTPGPSPTSTASRTPGTGTPGRTAGSGDRRRTDAPGDSGGAGGSHPASAGPGAGGGLKSLTVTAHGGTVTVSEPRGIDCPAHSCTAAFPPGTRVVLTAAARGATAILTGAGCPGTAVCTVTLNRDTTLRAVALPAPGRPGGPDGVSMLQTGWTDLSELHPAPVSYAWVDRSGRLLYGRQANFRELGVLHWVVLSGPGEFTGRPELVDGPGDAVAVVGQGTDGRVRSTSTATPEAGGWTDWVTLAEGVSLLRHTHPLQDSDSCPAVLGLDDRGGLWRMAPPFGGDPDDARLVGRFDLVTAAVAVDAVDPLRIVGVGSSGAVNLAEVGCDASISGWRHLGGRGVQNPPGLLVRPSGLLSVFIRSPDGAVLEKQEEEPGRFPATWTAAGDLRIEGSPGVAVDYLDRLKAVGRAADGQLRYSFWDVAGGVEGGVEGWGAAESTEGGPAVGDPTVSSYAMPESLIASSWIVLARTRLDRIQYAQDSYRGLGFRCDPQPPDSETRSCPGAFFNGLLPPAPPPGTAVAAGG